MILKITAFVVSCNLQGEVMKELHRGNRASGTAIAKICPKEKLRRPLKLACHVGFLYGMKL